MDGVGVLSMATKIKIAEFRKAYDGLDGARNWNQGGTTGENLRCDLAKQLAPRLQSIREMLPLVPDRFAKDTQNALESLQRAQRATLKNRLGRAVLFQILDSQDIPCGIYPEAKRVDVAMIWAYVASLGPSEVSRMLDAALDPDMLQSWILPDPDAKPSNCIKFPGT